MSQEQQAYRRHMERLKEQIDLHDLMDRLGVKRHGNVRGEKAQYFATWRDEQNPSVGVKVGKQGLMTWMDYGEGVGGSCIDLVMRVRGEDMKSAVRTLSEWYGIPLPVAKDDGKPVPKREEAWPEILARQCLEQSQRAYEYLRARRIPDPIIERAIAGRSIGFNEWTNPNVEEGKPGHGGAAVAFIVRRPVGGGVVAVEMRYVDADRNGKVKNNCQGDKMGHFWCTNMRFLLSDDCETVYVVESPINALTIEAARLPKTGVMATMGKNNIFSIDWRLFKGKKVVICFDHTDKVKDKEGSEEFGYRPGLKAAWALHEQLLAADVCALFVDQFTTGQKGEPIWSEGMDVNDLLKKFDGNADMLKVPLMQLEPWLIPGMPPPWKQPLAGGRSRLWLSNHHMGLYGKFRVRPDWTQWVKGIKTVKHDDGTETQTEDMEDVATFRVAAISKIKVQSDLATMTGDKDLSPEVLFAVSVQTGRHDWLQRQVFEDGHLHNLDKWTPFGSILSQPGFRRMVSVLETTTTIGQRNAVNFVGLCWRDGKLVVNEASDCYFQEPKSQCPYHSLVFPTGTPCEAREVIAAVATTFTESAGLHVMTWMLGAHLKAFLGFWPHLALFGEKNSGKSTFLGRMMRLLAFQLKSCQSMKSDYRILSSISYTSHPVGFEEFSKLDMRERASVISFLQECYNFNVTTRGKPPVKYLMSAAVLLNGEEVDANDILGKSIRFDITDKKGSLLPVDLPVFPVRQWLEFLARKPRQDVLDLQKRMEAHCREKCAAAREDDAASRIVSNFAAQLTAWGLLCEFAGIEPNAGTFGQDMITTMNQFVATTNGKRQPWVWIIERALSEIAMHEFKLPIKTDHVDHNGEQRLCLLVRPSHILDHMSRTAALRDEFSRLPIKTGESLLRQLERADVVLKGPDGRAKLFERTLGPHNMPGKRVSNLVALDVERLDGFGLHHVVPDELLTPLEPA